MISPVEQHKQHAAKILARRNVKVSNEPIEIKMDLDEAPVPDMQEADKYADLTKKDLKMLCREREINFPNKATNQELKDLLCQD